MSRRGKAKRKRPIRLRQPAADVLVGVFASCGLHALCDGDACLIAGSRAKMQHYLQQGGRDASQYTLQATSFSEILLGLQAGAAYVFDAEAYGRFRGPAQDARLPLVEEDVSEPGPGFEPSGLHLVRVSYQQR